jgi:hypothetical protein
MTAERIFNSPLSEFNILGIIIVNNIEEWPSSKVKDM